MKDFYPDILEHLGKHPREFGSHHVAADPIAVADGYGWVVLWFQAAFEPCDPEATFEIRGLLPAQRIPRLDGGAVARGMVRFPLIDDVPGVAISVKSRLDEDDAERCRQAWKLFDIYRAPDRRNEHVADDYEPRFERLEYQLGPVRENARPLFDALQVKVDFTRALPALADGFSILWRPGDPLPEPERGPPPVPPPKREPMTGYRECVKCNFSGKWKDFKDDQQCPHCGYWW